MTSSHARSLTTVLVAAILALMAAACGSPGSSNGGSAASGLASTSFDTSKKVTITMWDTENSPGPSKAVERAHLAVRAEVPERDGRPHGQELRRLHGDHQARRLVRQRARRLPGQRGIGRPGAGEGAPDRAARLAGQGLRLGQPLRQLGRAEPAALVGRRPALGHRQAVGHRPEGGGAGRLLQQGHHEAARHQGADHVRRVRAEPGGRQGRRACRRSWSATSTAGRWATSSWCCSRASTTPPRSPTGRTAGPAPPSTTPAPARPRRSSQQWGTKGYFENGFNGVSQTAAAARFGKGEGPLLHHRPLGEPDLRRPARATASASSRCRPWTAAPGAPTTGSLSLPYHISAKSQNQAVAAAFINLITDPHAAGDRDLERRPAGGHARGRQRSIPSSSLASISQAWGEKSKAGTLTPYLDWATPTMGDTLFGGLQQLSEGKVTPDAVRRGGAEGLGEGTFVTAEVLPPAGGDSGAPRRRRHPRPASPA